MKVYIVTANYISAMTEDFDCIVDSVWTNKEDADNKAKEIDDALTYPEGIYDIPYYGEVTEKELNIEDGYCMLMCKSYPPFANELKDVKEITMKMVNLDFSKLIEDEESK